MTESTTTAATTLAAAAETLLGHTHTVELAHQVRSDGTHEVTFRQAGPGGTHGDAAEGVSLAGACASLGKRMAEAGRWNHGDLTASQVTKVRP